MSVFISSAMFDRKAVLGDSLLLRLDDLVVGCAYTEPGSPPAVGGTGLQKVIMRREASPHPMNFCHSHCPSPELSLSKSTLLPIIFMVVMLYVPLCCKGT